MRYVIFASYGNDSVALIQWARESGLDDVSVLYSDTGWASRDWGSRVDRLEDWVRSIGYTTHRTYSIGLEALVHQKKGWPRQGMQFCTLELKIKPALLWLEKNDPQKLSTCLVGVRREESQNRKNFPEVLEVSPNHGDRKMWAPLVSHKEQQRNELLTRAGVEPLPHRSMDCFPCINSNRSDLRLLARDEERINKIAQIEDEMGTTSKGKKRTMFRPYRHMGAIGIREVVRWAESEHGEFEPIEDCETGYCGT